jgi:hypothetical protein
MKITITAIMAVARRNHRGCKDQRIFEYLKGYLKRFELPEGRYEELVEELREVIGV